MLLNMLQTIQNPNLEFSILNKILLRNIIMKIIKKKKKEKRKQLGDIMHKM